MTCNEFQLYLSGSHSDEMPIEAALHIEQCTACRHAAAVHSKLAADLRLVRESALAVPVSLDSAIIREYRSLNLSTFSVLRASRSNRRRSAGKRLALISAMGTVTAILLIAVVLVPQQRVDQIQAWNAPAPHAPEIAHTTIPKIEEANTLAIAKKSRRAENNRPQVVARNQQPQPAARAPIPVSGFQSLMYCDPLNCPGPMDVVRIQIPASTFNRFPAQRIANGYVQADVVVGSDGFARAIRIVH